MRPLYAEFIRQFVADEGSKQIIDIDTPRLVFPENFAKVQDFIPLINEEYGANRKGYILFGSISLVLSFVCILVDSNITQNRYIFVNGKPGFQMGKSNLVSSYLKLI